MYTLDSNKIDFTVCSDINGWKLTGAIADLFFTKYNGNILGVTRVHWRIYSLGVEQYIPRRFAPLDILHNPSGVYYPIYPCHAHYIITIRNGWKLWYGKYGLFYYKSIQDWWSYDLQNLGLKIHNFSLELKQSKTPPAASCWIISTLVRRYVFFNPRCCKSWDCPNISVLSNSAKLSNCILLM